MYIKQIHKKCNFFCNKSYTEKSREKRRKKETAGRKKYKGVTMGEKPEIIKRERQEEFNDPHTKRKKKVTTDGFVCPHSNVEQPAPVL